MGAAGLRQYKKTQKQKYKNAKIQEYKSTDHKNAEKYKNYKYTNTQTQGASEEITIGAVGLGRYCSSAYITATYTMLHFKKKNSQT